VANHVNINDKIENRLYAEFDMKNHLRETHKGKLPLKGMGFNINYRIGVAIERMKRRPMEFYDHRTAKSAHW